MKRLYQTYKEKLAALKRAEQELEESKNALIPKCPVKIGDVVKNMGYSRGEKSFVVDKIRFYDQAPYLYDIVTTGYFKRSEPGWYLCGAILKKDGTTGANRGEAYIFIDDVLEEGK